MRISTPICLLLLCLAASLPALARNEESIEQLKARVDAANPDEKIKVSLEIAERQVAAADKAFTMAT